MRTGEKRRCRQGRQVWGCKTAMTACVVVEKNESLNGESEILMI